MICSNCGTENELGAKFCKECGAGLSSACQVCGHLNPPNVKFCPECGAPVATGATAVPASRPIPELAVAPIAERRLVSILFADLVGSTALAEGRDPEETRELLTRYFDLSRDVIERYGGTVEKFIGDAVMAVWGAPTAHEDDAERAVRAGLELVDAVRQLGPTIQARAGVLTGEAAVTLGAVGQGMVAGDLVNTASRLQSVAPPGAVLVGEATQRAASKAIAFEEAGEQTLKGKTSPVPAWRALRVVAQVGGVGRSEGLEPPFVGRDEQLRLFKEYLHGTGRDKHLRFISVTGQAGTGKSRLAWEFHKYLDGLVEGVFYHHGRSPAYGEGITFWALGEMVRKRAGLAENDDQATTRERITAALDEYVPDEAERRWIGPKLLGLLGVEEIRGLEREELFAAWRTFFERVSLKGPTVLVFEDIQWADQGVLDFIDHLAEWSTNHPIMVVTLARADFLERHRDWGAGRRNFVALSLDPLPDEAMSDLLVGLVPGLPHIARQAIVSRAEGIPLYAVETVRKLLLDGRLELVEGVYRPLDDLSHLEVPDSLHALIAARLDGLDVADRRLIQDAAVLGETFAVAALASVAGEQGPTLEPRLHGLVRREILVHNQDPRSPERGQYGFVQALVREVAYDTLARRDRRTRHLAAARYFESLGDDELVGVLATHYLGAYRASAEGAEADAVAAQARIALRAAAERAAALHSPDQALAFLEAALEVTNELAERAGILESSAQAALSARHYDTADRYFREATVALRAIGDRVGVARLASAAGVMQMFLGRPTEAIAGLEPMLAEMADLDGAAVHIGLLAALARCWLFADDYDRALALADRGLLAAERIDDVSLITDLVLTKGTTLMYAARFREGLVLLSGGLELAETNGFVVSELRARLNISSLLSTDVPQVAYATAIAGLERARRLGFRDWSTLLAGNSAEDAFILGDWDWPRKMQAEFLAGRGVFDTDASDILGYVIATRAMRGETGGLEHELVEVDAVMAAATASQEQTNVAKYHALLDLAQGRFASVVDRLREAEESGDPQNGIALAVIIGYAALWQRDLATARRVVAAIDRNPVRGQWVRTVRHGLQAGVTALEGDEEAAEAGFREAIASLEDLSCTRDVLFCLMARAAVLPAAREGEARAREIIGQLGAVALGERLDEIVARGAAAPKLPAESGGPGAPEAVPAMADGGTS